jgi:flagellar hook protein FlgE
VAGEVSTIQSLKAVDAWIDVINANINGGVRTAFKSSRLKFAGSNTDVQRSGTTTSLPLQFPEPGLTTANTVIDFSQGAITASTENTHLAIQGTGFFVLLSPEAINTTAGAQFGATVAPSAGTRFLLTRDGEFRTDANGFVRHTGTGYYLVTYGQGPGGTPYYGPGQFGTGGTSVRAVYNDLDTTTVPAAGGAIRLSTFIANVPTAAPPSMRDFNGALLGNTSAITKASQGMQSLTYSSFGSTVFDFGSNPNGDTDGTQNPAITLTHGLTADATILGKSLEASNASMTQSVPELSLAQKLFSALTKVLQTKQTNVDGVLNLVR